MNYTYLHFQIGLSLLRGVGPIKARHLSKSVDDIAFIFTASPKVLHDFTGFSISFINSMQRDTALMEADQVIQFNLKHNIKTLYWLDDEYPSRLKECVDGPVVLYTLGNYNYNPQKSVAIVGTRSASHYGKQLVLETIDALKGKDIVVFSGLAEGIDTFVHQACLDNNIATVGVLGHGLDRIYPSVNKELARKMSTNGGLLTEFIPNTNPDRENFPKRNRIVAGIADATIVIESKAKGGSLITARLANDYNRDVFAYPGDVSRKNSEGCNNLIAENNAHLMQSPDSFLKLMEWSNHTKPVKQIAVLPELKGIRRKIVEQIIKFQGIQIDMLSYYLSIPVFELNNELLMLEMEGIVKVLPGKKILIA